MGMDDCVGTAEAFEDVLARHGAGDERAFAPVWRWMNPPLLRWLAVVAPGSASRTWRRRCGCR